MAASSSDLYIVEMGGVKFLRFLDHEGRPRRVSVRNINGWSPDNENPRWTVIFTAGALHGAPIRAPYPVEEFDKLGIETNEEGG